MSMPWQETVASQCRYGEIAGRIFGDADVIWERSEADYQGHANVFARLADGRFCHYEWTYGSCSGCDEWEDRGLSAEDVENEMRNAAAFFTDRATVRRYLHLDPSIVDDMAYPCANTPTNGSVAGMLRTLTNGRGEDFNAMRDAFAEWELAHPSEGASC